MKLKKITSGKIVLWSRGCGEIKSVQDFKDSISWRIRCSKHKVYKKMTKFLIKKMALTLLRKSDMYKRHINNKQNEPYIERFDKPKKRIFYRQILGEYKQDERYYSMQMRVAEYSFGGEKEYDIYLNLIKRIIVDEMCFPFCV